MVMGGGFIYSTAQKQTVGSRYIVECTLSPLNGKDIVSMETILLLNARVP